METVSKYLATMRANSTRPINHGLVELRDDGWVKQEGDDWTPVEDFGMYYLRDEPFPPTDSQELFDIFLALLAEQE